MYCCEFSLEGSLQLADGSTAVACNEETQKVGDGMSDSHKGTHGGRCTGQCKHRGIMGVEDLFEKVMFGGV